MRVAIGCDHAGFPLKPRILRALEESGARVVDCGTDSDQPSDYPVFAKRVAESLLRNEADRGILYCGSGVGVSVAVNKFPGIRACVCHDSYSARQGVEHDDMNVLCIGARIIGPELVADLVAIFLAAEFTGEDRHRRRLQMIFDIEKDVLAGHFPKQVE